MERLTKSKLVNGTPVCYLQNNSGLPEYILKRNSYRKIVEKLKEYEDLEEQKQLIKLPCAVGDTVWYWDKDRYSIEDAPVEGYVSEYKIGSKNSILIIITPKRDFASDCFYSTRDTLFIEDYGKTIFGTRQEAEDALKNARVIEN